jgi:pilus assembly protein CpaE
VPANFKELQAVVDAGRMQDLESKSVVKQALWGLAGELGIVKAPEGAEKAGKFRNDRGSVGPRRRRGTLGAENAHNTSRRGEGEG